MVKGSTVLMHYPVVEGMASMQLAAELLEQYNVPPYDWVWEVYIGKLGFR